MWARCKAEDNNEASSVSTGERQPGVLHVSGLLVGLPCTEPTTSTAQHIAITEHLASFLRGFGRASKMHPLREWFSLFVLNLKRLP
mmetsp:Transcript_71514/g.192582  ORF Transcript_71514/g.192582 Transcript_71514/m.192582 type:complete len:86 (-) Transcript_71514:18-275(-)